MPMNNIKTDGHIFYYYDKLEKQWAPVTMNEFEPNKEVEMMYRNDEPTAACEERKYTKMIVSMATDEIVLRFDDQKDIFATLDFLRSRIVEYGYVTLSDIHYFMEVTDFYKASDWNILGYRDASMFEESELNNSYYILRTRLHMWELHLPYPVDLRDIDGNKEDDKPLFDDPLDKMADIIQKAFKNDSN